VIDFERLQLHRPGLVSDLPGGASRLVQRADGYVTTVKRGVATFESGEDTGARPGRQLRGARSRPARSPPGSGPPCTTATGSGSGRSSARTRSTTTSRPGRARPASGPTRSRPGCASGWRAWSATSTARASWPRATTAS
jgi:hypothetical protein